MAICDRSIQAIKRATTDGGLPRIEAETYHELVASRRKAEKDGSLPEWFEALYEEAVQALVRVGLDPNQATDLLNKQIKQSSSRAAGIESVAYLTRLGTETGDLKAVVADFKAANSVAS